MKKLIYFLTIVSIMMLSSCKARVTDTNLKPYEKGVQYFQDQKTKEVFALVVIKTGVNAQEDGVGLAHIDRDDVTPEIITLIPNYQE